jgi:3-phosphoshikimate 1-carboxyvinyltransferase
VLARFGVRTTSDSATPDELRITVRGPLVAPAEPLAIEPDASSAAVALAAACLSGGALTVPGLGRESLQGDVRIVEHLAAFGCDARFDGDALVARGFPKHGATLDLGGEPDLAPVLAAIAAGAALRHRAPSVLTGLGTLPGKESDRLAGLARALTKLGLVPEVGADSLRIAPGPAPTVPRTSAPLVLDPLGDHRMAFAFALLGLVVPGVLVRDPRCVAKSWSAFWEDLAALGAHVQRG